MKKNIPQPMEDVRLSFTGEKVAQELADQLQRLLYNSILNHLRTRAVVTLHDLEEAGMPNVTLRLATVQLLFDGLRGMLHSFADSVLETIDSGKWASEADKLRFISSIISQDLIVNTQGPSDITPEETKRRLSELKKNYYDIVDYGPYKEGLENMGARIGWSFSLSLIEYARKNREEIPLSYDKLFEFWAIFDSATDIADRIDAHMSDHQANLLEVTIRESLLIRGRVRDNYQHVHCPFIIGYVLGVIDGLLVNWEYWISTEPYKIPDRHLRVQSAEETDPTVDTCYLKINFYEETEAQRRPSVCLAKAALNIEDKSFKDAIVDTRGALEECLRVGMGLPSNVQIKFSTFIEQAEKVGVKFSYKRFRHLHDKLSSIIHYQDNVHESTARDLLSEAWLLAREIPKEFSSEDQVKMNTQRKWFVQSKSE